MTISAAAPLVSADVRHNNLVVVMQYLVTHGPSSRSQISAGTGLARGSVTALAGVLISGGILTESPADAGGKGRPLTLLTVAADATALLAVQLDADNATALLTTIAGEQLFWSALPHGRPLGQPGAVIDVVARVLEQALDAAVGQERRIIATTVIVFAPTGGSPARVVANTDLGWGSVDLMGELRARSPRLPNNAELAMDAPLAALAEYSLRPGAGEMLYCKSNSGIGSSLVVDGAVFAGAHGIAGSFGHIALDHGGVLCGCGQYGCLVTVAGPDVVVAAAGLRPLQEQFGTAAALEELVARIAAGDATAVAAWDTAALWLARALNIVAAIVDPQTIVLGGYWARLVGPVKRAFEQSGPTVGDAALTGRADVVAGQLGDEAALIGAIWRARDRLLQDPLQLAAAPAR